MDTHQKTILITNDDGFEAQGLRALQKTLQPLARVVAVAPTTEKSASGHSLTLTRPLRFVQLEEDFYKLDDGTPSDCVFLALNKLFRDKKPDLVISGINHGSNMGEDITYSGTVAAAMEAVLQGIPAIAVSQVYAEGGITLQTLGFQTACYAVKTIVKRVFEQNFPLQSRRLLNINIPPVPLEALKGFQVTRAGNRLYSHHAEVHHNPRGLEYYWIGLPELGWIDTQGETTDFEAINKGYVSITPIHLDMTCYDELKSLRSWINR